MQSFSHGSSKGVCLLKRKRKAEEIKDCSDIENEPVNRDKRIKIEVDSMSDKVYLNDDTSVNTSQLVEVSCSSDERVPLTELSVANISVSSETTDDGVESIEEFNNVIDFSDFTPSTLNSEVNAGLSILRIECEPTPSTSYACDEKCDSLDENNFCIIPRRFGRTACPLPELEWSDENVLWKFLNSKDAHSSESRDANYFLYHSSIQPRMRSVLLEWLLEVCAVYKLQRETYYLALDYVDRYLSNTENISKRQLQLIGVTCLLIASKFEEIYPPKISEFAYITDGACVEADILIMEKRILKVLNWRSVVITANSWLSIFLQILHQADGKELNIVSADFSIELYNSITKVLDLCSFDEGFLQYSYKTIAVSAIYIMCSKVRSLTVSGMKIEEISKCVNWMINFYNVIKNKGEDNDASDIVGDDIGTSKQASNIWDAPCVHHVKIDLLDAVQCAMKKKAPNDDDCLLTPPLSADKT
ncbi:hypothetical protein O3M35_012562 [Rhynocoris fuscipes]|uniref:Cyclin N-terminal domain-containing protein n=1 Tax=Rhynocoris fuscipes TaxID=488301 RepID=A0AAW1D0R6_9HEMI